MLKRSTIAMALGLGFAAAMGSASAATLVTDSDRYERRSDDRRYDSRYDDRYDRRDRRYQVSGEWRLNPRLCPDLREDRRDRRRTYSRRDRREDRRDSRYIDCPARAWVWVEDGRGYRDHSSRGYRNRAIPNRPYYGRIRVNGNGDFYARYNGRDVRIGVVIR